MKLELIALTIFSSGLGVLGLWLMRWHAEVGRQQQADPQIESGLKLHYRFQTRRRIQAAGLLSAIGFLFNLSNEDLVPWERMPLLFTLYVVVLLLLTGWLVMLAIFDFAGNRLVHGAAYQRLQDQRRQLEMTLADHRRRQHQSGTSFEYKPPSVR